MPSRDDDTRRNASQPNSRQVAKLDIAGSHWQKKAEIKRRRPAQKKHFTECDYPFDDRFDGFFDNPII